MEIIALRGKNNCGKSQTLNIVYQYMLLFGYTQVPGHFRILGNRDNYDCLDILEKKGKRIGIAMMGDFEKDYPGDTVQDLITYLQTNGCEKAIVACNDGLSLAIAFIQTFSHVFIPKTMKANDAIERIVNGEDAERIYRLI